MTSLDKRISKLERASLEQSDVEDALLVLEAYDAFFRAGEDVSELSESHRAIVAVTSRETWQLALWTMIVAAGGLAKVVQSSVKRRLERKGDAPATYRSEHVH